MKRFSRTTTIIILSRSFGIVFRISCVIIFIFLNLQPRYCCFKKHLWYVQRMLINYFITQYVMNMCNMHYFTLLHHMYRRYAWWIRLNYFMFSFSIHTKFADYHIVLSSRSFFTPLLPFSTSKRVTKWTIIVTYSHRELYIWRRTV